MVKFLTAEQIELKNICISTVPLEAVEIYDNAPDSIMAYVGKKMYCICMEDENSNNVIVDKESGDKLFIIPENDVLAELREISNAKESN